MKLSVRFGGVVVNAASSLASEASGLHVLRQQRARAKLLAERSVEVFENVQARVESDEVHEFEGAHRVIESELKRLVDVGGGGNAFLQHVKRLVADHGVDAAGDEARRLAD